MVMKSQILICPTRYLGNNIFMNSRKQGVLLVSLLLLFSILLQLGFFVWQAERIFGDEQAVYLKIVPSQSNFPLFTDFADFLVGYMQSQTIFEKLSVTFSTLTYWEMTVYTFLVLSSLIYLGAFMRKRLKWRGDK